MARISYDNGKTFCTPMEAYMFFSMDAITACMDKDIMEAVLALSPKSDTAFIEAYLERASEDLIIKR